MPFDISTGFVPETFDEIVELYRDAARRALGPTVDLGPESPLGQFIGLLAIRDNEIQERLLAVANGLSRQRAAGYQLDDLYSIFGIPRLEATRSTVTVTCTGTDGTVIPAGNRAATTTGAEFRLTGDTTIPAPVPPATLGSVDAQMEAVEIGPVMAAAGTLTRIIDSVVGWDAVTNAADAEAGRTRETTAEYRVRAARETDRNAVGTQRAIEAAVYQAGAEDVVVRINNTDAAPTVRGVTVVAHGVLVIAAGGENEDIANAIVRTVPAGIATGTGGVTVSVDYEGVTQDVQFSRPTDVQATIAIEIDEDPTLFPGDGQQRIQEAVIEYVHSLPIGRAIDINQIIFAVYGSLPARSVVVTMTPTAMDSSNNDLSDENNVDINHRLRTSVDNVTVTPV